MKLFEIKNKSPYQPHLKPWMYTDANDIEDWIKKVRIKGMVKPKELEIDCAENRTDIMVWSSTDKHNHLVQHNGKWYLPVQFNLAPNFGISGLAINSLEGFPRVVLGDLTFDGVEITDLKGFPSHVGGEVKGSSEKTLTSFKGIADIETLYWHSPIKSIEGLPKTLINLSIQGWSNFDELKTKCPNLTHLGITDFPFGEGKPLSAFKLKKLQAMYLHSGKVESDIIKQGNAIINKHLQNGRDVLLCQEELMDAGLRLFAR